MATSENLNSCNDGAQQSNFTNILLMNKKQQFENQISIYFLVSHLSSLKIQAILVKVLVLADAGRSPHKFWDMLASLFKGVVTVIVSESLSILFVDPVKPFFL